MLLARGSVRAKPRFLKLSLCDRGYYSFVGMNDSERALPIEQAP